MTNYEHHSHRHCFDYGKEAPPCGVPIHIQCCLCDLPTPTEAGEKPLEDWEKEFDEKFNFWKDITITPRQAGDFDNASLLEQYYRDTGERLKSFISQEITRARREELEDLLEHNDTRDAHPHCVNLRTIRDRLEELKSNN